jgi:hypothetical protein
MMLILPFHPQENILRRPDRHLLNLEIDSGGVQPQRIIESELARRGAVAGG